MNYISVTPAEVHLLDVCVITSDQSKIIEVLTEGRQGIPGPQGEQGEQGPDFSYLHLQPTASATWVINHNLGVKPVVQLFSIGSQVFEGLITHTSDNQCVATMTMPVAGFARLT